MIWVRPRRGRMFLFVWLCYKHVSPTGKFFVSNQLSKIGFKISGLFSLNIAILLTTSFLG